MSWKEKRERESKREVERETAKKRVLTGKEHTMGVQVCIPTNKQSDGGEERGEKRRQP